MNTSSVSLQNASEYITLLSNPMFLNAVKSALGKSQDDKSSALLSNLEKLSSLLPSENADNSNSSLSSLNLSSLLGTSSLTSSTSETDSSKYTDQSLDQIVADLIANADLLESLVNWDFVLPDEDMSSLFKRFRDIIAKLDEEMGKIREEVKNKEVKSELKLRPSSNTKSGFAESLSLVAQ